MKRIDLSQGLGLSREAFDCLVTDIYHASSQEGCFLLEGHGIPLQLLREARQALRHVFALSHEQKMSAKRPCGRYRGYIERTTFADDERDGPPVMYEGFVVGTEIQPDDPEVQLSDGMFAPNLWPAGAPDIQQSLSDYWQAITKVSNELLKPFAVSVGQDTHVFLDYFYCPLSNLVLVHYPADENSDCMAPKPHTDSSAFTVLLLDDVAGLELQRRSGEWEPAPQAGDALLVIVGEMMQAWTGGLYRAAPHRVRSPRNTNRATLAYFVSPSYRTMIAPKAGELDNPIFHFSAGARFKQYVGEFD